MTAAEVRPPLFNHLVASRPDRDGNSLSSTVTSVVLHAAIVAAAVVATARVRAPAPVIEKPPIVIVEPIVNPASKSPSGGGQRGATTTAPEMLPPDLPNVVPGEIPKSGSGPVGYIEGPIRFDMPTSISAGPGNGINVMNPGGGFVVVTVLPKLLNRIEVQRAMVRLYPSTLQQAGIGGTSVVWLQLDEEGRVVDTQIKKGSGQLQLDNAALAIGKSARFSPALNGDVKVKVWIELPVVFSVGR